MRCANESKSVSEGRGQRFVWRRHLYRAVLVSLLVLLSSALQAAGNGITQLRQFVETAGSASGRFEQQVTASSGRRPQQASGTFAFERPGRFRWTYETPYPQLLVSDGERLWVWDQDLNQVTVKTLGDALGSTPAAILAGGEGLDNDFELAEAGQSDGLDWVSARPRSESSFETMRIGLREGKLVRMELRDHFGQTTVIDFVVITTGVEHPPEVFQFEPPVGADVIGD